MLTKNDLNQIRGIVKEEIKIEVTPLSKKIEVLDKKLDKVQEDIGEYLNRLEPRVTIVEKRIDDVEEHLNFPKTQ